MISDRDLYLKACTNLRGGQIELIEINYDAHTNAVRPCTIRQYDTFLIGFFKILILY